jgi:Na+/H+-dicarboxylate symporter
MFRKMPIFLIALILLLLAVDNYLPHEVKAFLYAVSLTIKSFIITLLPVIIFGLLFKVMTQLAKQATKIILLILALVCCSNFLSTFISHYVGMWVYHFDLSLIQPKGGDELEPLWTLPAFKLIANDKAMFAGLILGIAFSYLNPRLAGFCANQLDKLIGKLLQVVTFVIPFFVLGFVIKLNYDGSVAIIFQDYALIFVVIALAQFCYISLIYFLSNHLNAPKFWTSIKNMFPAALTGFSTMSSAAAMPLTILGTEKNAKNPDLARSVIPATVNIHLMGDCFAIPILAYAILKSFDLPEPLLFNYLIFAFYFVVAKFSVAAVPGGGIIVMLPILESYLGFNAEMMSLITALYILFDPVITSANVLGNGGFAMVVDKFTGLVRKPGY